MKPIAFRYGLLMFVCLVAFFLLMYAVGWSHHYNLRLLNGVFHLGFMYAAISLYTRRYPEEANNYISGVGLGMWMGTIAVGGFAAFLTAFLAVTPDLVKQLQQVAPLGGYLTPITAGASILLEGMAVSLIGSYIIVRIVLASIGRA